MTTPHPSNHDTSGAAQPSQGISDTQLMMLHNDAIGLRDCDGYAPGAQTGRDILATIARLRTAEAIVAATLAEIPVGYLPKHTPENMAAMVGDLVRRHAEQDRELEAAEAERDKLRESESYLEDTIAKARSYKGIEGYPCPLCRYVDGEFEKACSLHEQIDALRDDVAAIFAQTEPPFDGATKAQHVIRFIGNLRDDVARLTRERDNQFWFQAYAKVRAAIAPQSESEDEIVAAHQAAIRERDEYAAAQNAAANEMRIQRARAENAEEQVSLRDMALDHLQARHDAAVAAKEQAEAKLAKYERAMRDCSLVLCETHAIGYSAKEGCARCQRDLLAAALAELRRTTCLSIHYSEQSRPLRDAVSAADALLADLGRGAGCP